MYVSSHGYGGIATRKVITRCKDNLNYAFRVSSFEFRIINYRIISLMRSPYRRHYYRFWRWARASAHRVSAPRVLNVR